MKLNFNKTFINNSYKSQMAMVFLFACPWILLVIIGFFKIAFFKGYLREIITYGLFTFMLYAITLLINNVKIKKWLCLFFIVVLSFLVIVKLSFYHHYDVKLSASAWFVILETYSSEAFDFLNNYLDGFTIVMSFIVFLPIVLLLVSKSFKMRYLKAVKFKTGVGLKFFLLLSILFSGFIIFKKFHRENLILMSMSSYREYVTIKTLQKTELSQPESKHLTNVFAKDDSQNYVVIIGESTSSWHMQLYGYSRETNPNLSRLKDELFVFDSVITPHVHTINALEKIMTLSNYGNPNKSNNASLIQLANKAGFETYWLSSQRPVGFHESLAATISGASNQTLYTNTEHHYYPIYDGDLLPKLDNVLNDTKQKRLIFIHLIGTHMAYNRRYPSTFDYFNDDLISSKYKSDKAIIAVNTYDNAIRYNDYIVYSIIEKVKAKQNVGYVLYFSDHGDEVYDTMDFLGHNEYHATRPMFEVPFIVWLSQEYKIEYGNFISKDQLSRPYNLEDFIHSFSDISRIRFDEFDETRSIFSPKFEKRTRWIKKDVDYDHR